MLGAFAMASCAQQAPLELPVMSKLQSVDGRKAAEGNLELHVDPADAKVEIDGVEQGRASDFDGLTGCLKLRAGSHQLGVSKEGYTAIEMTVYASDDGRQLLKVELQHSQ